MHKWTFPVDACVFTRCLRVFLFTIWLRKLLFMDYTSTFLPHNLITLTPEGKGCCSNLEQPFNKMRSLQEKKTEADTDTDICGIIVNKSYVRSKLALCASFSQLRCSASGEMLMSAWYFSRDATMFHLISDRLASLCATVANKQADKQTEPCGPYNQTAGTAKYFIAGKSSHLLTSLPWRLLW